MSETHTLTVAKADKDDRQTTLDFLEAAELALDNERFSFLRSPQDKWEKNLDDDDPDKIIILAIRKSIAEEEGIKEKNVDNRILMYEFLQLKFSQASCNWRRVLWAADLLIEQACDPTEDYLAFYPGMECFHVAPEM